MLLHCTITKGTVIDKVILVLDFLSFATTSNVSGLGFMQSIVGVTALNAKVTEKSIEMLFNHPSVSENWSHSGDFSASVWACWN